MERGLDQVKPAFVVVEILASEDVLKTETQLEYERRANLFPRGSIPGTSTICVLTGKGSTPTNQGSVVC